MMRKIIWKNFTGPAQQSFVAKTELSGTREVALHTHDFPEVFWVENGGVEYELAKARVFLNPNDLVMVKPEDVHGFRTLNGKYVSFMNLAFCPDVLKIFSERYFSGKPDFWGNPDNKVISMSRTQIEFLHSAAMKLAEAPDSVFETDFFILSLFKEIGYRDHILDFSRCPVWLKNACEKMKFPDNFARGVPGLNEFAGRTPEHTARTLKLFTGMTPLQVINIYRMEYAAVQLRMTSKEIIDISSECGFDSLSHFYRVFKFRFGLSPGNYRKRNRRLVYRA